MSLANKGLFACANECGNLGDEIDRADLLSGRLLFCADNRNNEVGRRKLVKVNISYLVIVLVTGLSPSILLGQNVSWADWASGSSYKLTADRTRSAFTSMSVPSDDMVFDSTCTLFKMDFGGIYESKPDAARNTFDSGLVPLYPVFDSTACLIEANSSNSIPEFIPDGTLCVLLSWLVPPDLTFKRYEFVSDVTFSSVSGMEPPYCSAIYRYPEPVMACLPCLGLLSMIWMKR
jgi:hypothetical protein